MWGSNTGIVCVQETKMRKEQLDENYACPGGWECMYSFYTCQSSKSVGYSGVATFVRKGVAVPVAAHTSLTWNLQGASKEKNEWDDEGRCLITDHGDFILYNLYAPASRVTQEGKTDSLKQQKITDLMRISKVVEGVLVRKVQEERQDSAIFAILDEERYIYKRKFFALLEQSVREVVRSGRQVMIVGDLNVALAREDHFDPLSWEVEVGLSFESSEFRLWMKQFLRMEGDETALLDLFRVYFPDRPSAFTCWNQKNGSRITNSGTRIDYILLSTALQGEVTNCDILPEMSGSDHCPVRASLSNPAYPRPQPTSAPPLAASKMPQFRKRL